MSRNSFNSRNESELKAFDHAAAQLEKMGVDPKVDPRKVIGLIKELEREAADIRVKQSEIEKRMYELRGAKIFAERLLDRQHDQGQKGFSI